MSEVIDTLGWDLAISMPLSSANARLRERAALIRLAFEVQDGRRSSRLRGCIDGYRLVRGQGSMSRVELSFREFGISYADAHGGAVRTVDLAGLVVAVGLVLELDPATRHEMPSVFDLGWFDDGSALRGDADGDNGPTLRASIESWPDVPLPHEVRSLCEDILTRGLQANLPALQRVLLDSLACKISMPSASACQDIRKARQTCVLSRDGDQDTVVLLISLTIDGRTDNLSAEAVRRLQPIVPAGMSVDGTSVYVAMARRLLPVDDLAGMVAKTLERAQMPANFPYLYLMPPVESSFLVHAVTPACFLEVARHGAHSEIRQVGNVVLALHDESDVWWVTVKAFSAEILDDEIVFQYCYFPTHFGTPERKITQRFRIHFGIVEESLRGSCMALMLEQTGLDDHGTARWPTEFLSDKYDALVRLHERIDRAAFYQPMGILIDLFGEIRLRPGGGHVNGGALFPVTLEDLSAVS